MGWCLQSGRLSSCCFKVGALHFGLKMTPQVDDTWWYCKHRTANHHKVWCSEAIGPLKTCGLVERSWSQCLRLGISRGAVNFLSIPFWGYPSPIHETWILDDPIEGPVGKSTRQSIRNHGNLHTWHPWWNFGAWHRTRCVGGFTGQYVQYIVNIRHGCYIYIQCRWVQQRSNAWAWLCPICIHMLHGTSYDQLHCRLQPAWTTAWVGASCRIASGRIRAWLGRGRHKMTQAGTWCHCRPTADYLLGAAQC